MKLVSALAAAASLAMIAAHGASAGVCSQNACSTRLMGVVSSGANPAAQPVQGARVAIYRAGVESPVLLAETVTNARGQFSANLPRQAADEIRYAVAANGRTEMMTVMAASDRPHLRINEMTTVASAYAMAQFFDGKEISGKTLPLQVAAGMFRNLATPDRGDVSQVLRRSPNADETNARRLMATLSNVLANCVRNGATDSCAPLFAVTGDATTTLEAAIEIAHNPARSVHEIFALGSVVQPFQPALLASMGPDATDELMRLDAFTVAVKVNRTGNKGRRGKEACPFGGTGNLVFDDMGHAWITNNVVQGTTKSTNCFAVLKPDGSPADGKNGTPRSPIFGGGVLGQGFGIGRDPSGNIWAGNFGWGGDNPIGSVSKFSSAGKALSPAPNGYISNLNRVQGTTSDNDGNIWMASNGNDRVQVFPNGNPDTTYPYYADSNTAPFHILVDDDGAAYVSYTGTSALSKFTMGADALVLEGSVPVGDDANPKGIGLDTTGHVWVTAGKESKVYLFDSNLVPHGSFDGGSITGPWGLSVDSRDNVWVANFGLEQQLPLKYRMTQLCGTNTANCPAGMTTGDGISPATGWTLPSGGDQVRLASGKPLYYPRNVKTYKPLMRATTTQVDMAGNVWVTNNWKPSGANDLLTNPGGDGMVIFVGMAAPVKPGTGLPKAP
jgi:streptogramin lyase